MSSVVSELSRTEQLVALPPQRPATPAEELDNDLSAGRGFARAALVGGAFWIVLATALWAYLA